jgi:dihydroorotase
MKVLIKNAFIADASSLFFETKKDILIEDGIICKIANNITVEADQVLAAENLQVSTGWVDSFAHFCDPGYEHKETLQTGAAAAAAGGFTDVLIVPNTKPVIDSKSQVQYITQHSDTLAVNIHPIGSITKNAAGKELAEMYDMHNSGAVCFSDGLAPVQSANLLIKALQYVKTFAGIIIQLPEDTSIATQGLMHEGVASTQLGLPGKPILAEELMVARDIKLARYAQSSVHFTGITSTKSLQYIKRAKEGGIAVSCSVTPYHLAFCDEDLIHYNTHLKVNLPLRTRSDMMALRTAVEEGLVDCIASHHTPQDADSKLCEFEYAKYGMTSIETCYSTLKKVFPTLPESSLIKLLSTNPRKIFGLPAAVITENAPAHITLFIPDKPWVYEKSNIHSASYNSPFIGQTLTGKALGIINGKKIVWNPL